MGDTHYKVLLIIAIVFIISTELLKLCVTGAWAGAGYGMRGSLLGCSLGTTQALKKSNDNDNDNEFV